MGGSPSSPTWCLWPDAKNRGLLSISHVGIFNEVHISSDVFYLFGTTGKLIQTSFHKWTNIELVVDGDCLNNKFILCNFLMKFKSWTQENNTIRGGCMSNNHSIILVSQSKAGLLQSMASPQSSSLGFGFLTLPLELTPLHSPLPSSSWGKGGWHEY